MNNIDAIIDKIKKAVRLANRTTEEGERAVALRLARSMAERNGLAFDEIEASAGGAEETKTRADNTDEWHSYDAGVDGRICGILREHFAVVMMLNLNKLKHKVRYTFFGCSVNIDTAKYVCDILRREARKAWRGIKELEKLGVTGYKLSRADFMRGFFFAIHQKLTEHPIRNDADQLAAERKNAEDAFAEYKASNRVEEKSHKRGKDDTQSILRGIDSASHVSLNRPCGNYGTRGASEIARRGNIAIAG